LTWNRRDFEICVVRGAATNQIAGINAAKEQHDQHGARKRAEDREDSKRASHPPAIFKTAPNRATFARMAG
jgi:hypothetical protein